MHYTTKHQNQLKVKVKVSCEGGWGVATVLYLIVHPIKLYKK
jgi:hypothetical protein